MGLGVSRREFRFWHISDIEGRPSNDRYWGKSGHRNLSPPRLLLIDRVEKHACLHSQDPKRTMERSRRKKSSLQLLEPSARQ